MPSLVSLDLKQLRVALADEDEKVVLPFLDDAGANEHVAEPFVAVGVNDLWFRVLTMNEEFAIFDRHEKLILSKAAFASSSLAFCRGEVP